MRSALTFLISVIVGVVALSSTAHAQDESVKLKYRGADGQWFPMAMVDQMQEELLTLDACREREARLNVKLDLRLKRIKELNVAVAATTEALEIAKGAVSVAEGAMDEVAERAVAAEERAAAAEEKMGKWYRHPVTWVGVGVVVTVAVEFIVYMVVK